MKSLRLLLIVSMLFWGLGPAVAYAEPGVPTYRISVSPTVDYNQVGQPHDFNILLEESNDDTIWENAAGHTVSYTYKDVNGVATDSSGTTGPEGTVVVTENSSAPGQGSLVATYEGVTSNTALKYWEKWKIEISPTNLFSQVGEPNKFTLQLSYNAGAGWRPTTAGQQVTLTLLDGPGYFTSPVAGQSGTGFTDKDGQIAIETTADVAGTSTLTGSYGVVSGSLTITYADTAQSNWEEWRVEITPDEPVSMIGETNKFTLQLSYNTGAGWRPTTAGQQVALTLDSPGYFTSPVAGQSGTGFTDGNGQIAIVATSDVAGTSTLTGSYGVVSGSGTITYYTDTADKTWKAGEIKGTVFRDLNANGTQDTGESPLPGWTVKLFEEDRTTVLANQVTSASGAYKFENLEPGTYYVAETLGGPEWSNTTPIKRMVEVIYDAESNEIFVTPIDVNFGNDMPFLPFTPDSTLLPPDNPLLPYTGGWYYQHTPYSVGSRDSQNTTSLPLLGSFSGLIVAVLAAGALLAARKLRSYEGRHRVGAGSRA